MGCEVPPPETSRVQLQTAPCLHIHAHEDTRPFAQHHVCMHTPRHVRRRAHTCTNSLFPPCPVIPQAPGLRCRADLWWMPFHGTTTAHPLGRDGQDTRLPAHLWGAGGTRSPRRRTPADGGTVQAPHRQPPGQGPTVPCPRPPEMTLNETRDNPPILHPQEPPADADGRPSPAHTPLEPAAQPPLRAGTHALARCLSQARAAGQQALGSQVPGAALGHGRGEGEAGVARPP